MIKNLALATLITVSPLTPKNTFYYNQTFNRTYQDTARQQLSSSDKYAVYYNYGNNSNNDIGGPSQRTKAINIFTVEYDELDGYTINNDIYIYTQIITNSLAFNGQMEILSQLQLDKANYTQMGFDYVELTWEKGYNLTNIASYMFTGYSTFAERQSQVNNAMTTINAIGFDYHAVTNTSSYRYDADNIIREINNYANNTIEMAQGSTTNNSFGYFSHIHLERLYLEDSSQIAYYRTALDNYEKSLTFSMSIAESGSTTINYEVIDLPGLLFSILGMPFAWISTAFNLTIFPGTPYALNISALFLAIIGVLVLIFILKKILK